MIRRILVIGSLGLVDLGAGRLALEELTERRWEQRRAELLELAILPAKARRPWEVRFESLSERVQSSPRFDEIVESGRRPYTAVGSGEARALDEFERLWLEALWNELSGLDGVLVALRTLPLEDLGWSGEAPRLRFARELTNALCGRAWLALEDGDPASAVLAWTDALRLARALDTGTILGAMIRGSSEDTVLRSVRSALQMGGSATVLRAELMPFYLDWGSVEARAEHSIRRELANVDGPGAPDDPAEALGYFLGVEEALARTGMTARDLERARDEEGGRFRPPMAWEQVILHFHDLHARRNVACTALAVAAWREQHGGFPATLAELDTLEREFTLDPRSGTELPYSPGDFQAQVGPPSWAEPDEDPESPSLYAWTLR
jgi:hypothetical protein